MARTIDREPKARNDAYTGLLAISFLALVGGTVFMALDADEIGKPPAKLSIDVPGTTQGRPGDGLRRPDVGGKIDTTEVPPPPAPMPPMPKAGDMGRNEPGRLPALGGADERTAVVPVKAETTENGPPLPVKPFVPPM